MKTSWLLPLAALLHSSVSFGFCRATTCDLADVSQHCQQDVATECVITGTPLFRSGGCLTVNVQSAGAPSAGVGAADAEASVRRALNAWLTADCGNGSPSLAVELGERVSCDASEYSRDRRNANIVMFREGQWPYEGAEDALGVTRLRFDLERAPGEIWDADIELNAVTERLAVGTPKLNEVDLDSLITHEMGHLLGLGHSLAAGATMMAGYEKGSTELRSLSADDVAGICAIYPPGRDIAGRDCTPRHGFSELCAADQPPLMEPDDEEETSSSSQGCALGIASAPSSGAWLYLVGAAWLVGRRRFTPR